MLGDNLDRLMPIGPLFALLKARRRHVTSLRAALDLDDRLLKDVGLTRDDLRAALRRVAWPWRMMW